MKRYFRVHSIQWETDGQKICSLGLPAEIKCLELDVGDSDTKTDIKENICDWLSNEYGFLVESFVMKELDMPDSVKADTPLPPESRAPYCGTDLASGKSWTVITVCDSGESMQEVVLGQLIIPTHDSAELSEEIQNALDGLSLDNPERQWSDIRDKIVEIVKKHGIKIIEPAQTTVYG